MGGAWTWLYLVVSQQGAIVANLSNQKKSQRILARLACENDCLNLSSLAKKAGGEFLLKLLAYMIILFVIGSTISYQIIICSLFKYFIKRFSVIRALMRS